MATLTAAQSTQLTLVALADCVCEQLATTGAGPTCWCGLYPGAQVSWEYCGECSGDVCGMGYVRLAGIAPYDVFPTPIVDDRCTKPLAVAVELGALRCLPNPPDGELVTASDMADVALAQAADAEALRQAVLCCTEGLALGQYVPVGPAGGCVGGFWTAYFSAM